MPETKSSDQIYEPAGPYYYRPPGSKLSDHWDHKFAVDVVSREWSYNLSEKLRAAGLLDQKKAARLERQTNFTQKLRIAGLMLWGLAATVAIRAYEIAHKDLDRKERDERTGDWVRGSRFFDFGNRLVTTLSDEIRDHESERLIAYAIKRLPEKDVIESIPSYTRDPFVAEAFAKAATPWLSKARLRHMFDEAIAHSKPDPDDEQPTHYPEVAVNPP